MEILSELPLFAHDLVKFQRPSRLLSVEVVPLATGVASRVENGDAEILAWAAGDGFLRNCSML